MKPSPALRCQSGADHRPALRPGRRHRPALGEACDATHASPADAQAGPVHRSRARPRRHGWFDDLGMGRGRASAEARLGGAATVAGTWRAGPRTAQGRFGDVAVVAGCAGMTAPRCWRGPRLAQAPGVFVRCSCAGARARPARPELMLRPGWSRRVDPATLAQAPWVRLRRRLGGADACPPLLVAARAWCSTPMRSTPSPRTNRCAAVRRPRRATTVITPHPLEAARLLEYSRTAIQADRLARRAGGRTSSPAWLTAQGPAIVAGAHRALHQRQRRPRSRGAAAATCQPAGSARSGRNADTADPLANAPWKPPLAADRAARCGCWRPRSLALPAAT